MTDTVMPLAAEFPQATRDEWLKLVEKALKGGSFEKRMVARTADGIRIEPLYTRDEALAAAATAVPGAAPFVRGFSAEVEGFGWSIEQMVVAGDAARANATVLAELEGGASGVVLRLAAPGQSGIAITSAADFARLLSGVYLDFAPIVIDAGASAGIASGQFAEAMTILGQNPAKVAVRFDIDPLGVAARTGHSALPLADAVATATKTAAGLKARFPASRTILVDARVAHEAGASEAQELAVMAGALVTYLRAFEAAGVDVAAALGQITIALTADADLFLTVAKLRAARRIVGRIAEASGAPDAAAGVRLAVTTSARMMTKRDPWTNMLRTTAATTGAAFGGADAIAVLPFTWPLGMPDAFALRIARNTQLVAQEESSLGRVVDPAGGSWYVERLTDEVARKAWGLFREMEEDGGLIAELMSGRLARELMQAADERQTAIATGRQPLTGTSAFPLLGDDGVKVTPWPQAPRPLGDTLIEPLMPRRLAEPFEVLRDAADAHAARTGKRPTVFLASLGTIAEHTARTTWIRNQLAVAGIEALVSDGYASPADAAEAFKGSHTSIACICSSDDMVKSHGEATAKALVEAGATHVLMAGRPGDLEATLRAAGVDGFLYAGQNALDVLTELQHELTS